jgi:hypothetical protein
LRLTSAKETARMGRGPAKMTKQRTVRLPGPLWDRIDTWMMTAEAEGVAVNHSEALRLLLLAALDTDDKRRARNKAKALEGEGQC